jgi:hypothetical protein
MNILKQFPQWPLLFISFSSPTVKKRRHLTDMKLYTTKVRGVFIDNFKKIESCLTKRKGYPGVFMSQFRIKSSGIIFNTKI